MINWCGNRIDIGGESSIINEMFQFAHGEENGKDVFNFECILPRSKDLSELHTWRVENWGIKWNTEQHSVERFSDSCAIYFWSASLP